MDQRKQVLLSAGCFASLLWRGLVAGLRHGRRKEAHRAAPGAGSVAWVVQVAELLAAVCAVARGDGAEGSLAPEVAALSLVALAAGLVSSLPYPS